MEACTGILSVDEQKKVADLKEIPQSFDRGSAVVIVSVDWKTSVEPEDVATVAGQQTAAECMLAGATLGFSSGEMFANAEALESALRAALCIFPLPLVASFLAKEV